MSLLKFLQFQPIDPASDVDEIDEDHKIHQEIQLNEQLDDQDLEKYWEDVVKDIHKDPQWYTFSDE
jgi:hypothetical protein